MDWEQALVEAYNEWKLTNNPAWREVAGAIASAFISIDVSGAR